MCRHLAVFAAADRADSLVRAGRRAAVAILGFRMAGVTLTDSGVGLFIAVLRPSAPVVVQHIAGEEGRLIRRALGAQTADCAGLVVDCLFRAGGGGFQVLCIHGLRREVVGQLFAILSLAKLTDGILGAGCFAAGVLRVAFLSRVIRHIAVFIGAFMPVMRCIGRPIGLPAMARGWNRLYFCCVALGAAICLFARFCAGRRCCYRTVVPSMRAYVILYIATGTLLPVLVIIMCPTGSKIMSQNIAIFRTANCACCSLGAGGRATGAVLCFHDIAGAVAAVGAVAVRCPVTVVLMSIALSLEHGQGYFCRSHILAAVPWRIVAASLKLLQHVTVGKFRGGFGGSIEICVRVAQIVAVGGSAIIIGGDCDFTNISATSDFADIIAVGNLSVHIKSADTSGVATAVVASAGDFSDVIAIADY